jgi:hypothetical protein
MPVAAIQGLACTPSITKWRRLSTTPPNASRRTDEITDLTGDDEQRGTGRESDDHGM